MAESTQEPPLATQHRAAGAKVVPFASWAMPLDYSRGSTAGGVLVEHAAVREAVGLFDVSHLGTVVVAGPSAAADLDGLLTNDLQGLPPGHSQYTLLCASDGGVLDDLIVHRVTATELVLVPNAANAAVVTAAVQDAAGPGTQVRDEQLGTVILAVQGPRSAAAMVAAGLPHEMPYLSVAAGDAALGGVASDDPRGSGRVLTSRTGYTGEHGYEVMLPVEDAAEVFDRLAEAVARLGGRLCGLAARDTLRTEMAYPLHGQDLTPEVNPLEAGLRWAIGWDKERFQGRDSLLEIRDRGPRRRSYALRCRDAGVPRPGMAVTDGAGRSLGRLTSGTFSPTLRTGIALALLSADEPRLPSGHEVVIDIRGRACRASVVTPPFVPSHVR